MYIYIYIYIISHIFKGLYSPGALLTINCVSKPVNILLLFVVVVVLHLEWRNPFWPFTIKALFIERWRRFFCHYSWRSDEGIDLYITVLHKHRLGAAWGPPASSLLTMDGGEATGNMASVDEQVRRRRSRCRGDGGRSRGRRSRQVHQSGPGRSRARGDAGGGGGA